MRTLLKLVLVVAVIVIAAFVLLDGWRPAAWRGGPRPVGDTAATTGALNTERARAIGAEIGEKTAVATERVKETAHDASITGKIKAKMALDELVDARAIDVSTDGTTVTLSGRVDSAAARDRAVALAKETSGVQRVQDLLVIR
jgi:osmotically-inducible protein OsmY